MRNHTKWLMVVFALMFGLLLNACDDDDNDDTDSVDQDNGEQVDQDDDDSGQDDDDDADDPDGPGNGETATFSLQLLHFADVDGAGGVDDVRNFSALVDGFRTEYPDNTLVLSSGDNLIPGPEFFAAGDAAMADVLVPGNGHAHIAWLNAMGVQASVVGNHDLDAGVEDFAELISTDGDWPGAQFPYLSANIDFSNAETADLIVEDGQPVQANSVAGSATIEVDGQTIGIVGASVPTLPSITSTGDLVLSPAEFDPNNAEDLDALAAAIQPAVDALITQGINKVILLAHMQQLAIEQALAQRLEGVDIIVAGGSNTLLADSNDRLRDGDTAADTYPLRFTSPTEEPVLVVNTDGDFTYLGRLLVEFNDNGVIATDSIDPAISGAYATDTLSQPFEPIDAVDAIADALEGVLAEKDGNVLGLTDVYLDGRRSQVRTEETNLGNLTADANLWYAQQADPNVQISLKNGGGIRSDIGQANQPYGSNDPADIEFLPPAANSSIDKPAGGISQLDLETSLRFNNGLTLLTVTAAELADIVEHAVAGTAEGATPGQFPQVAGLRFSFDPSQPARDGSDTNAADVNINGDRLRNLAVVDDSGAVIDQVVEDGVVVGDQTRTFRLVILDFIAKCVGAAGESCGDSYPLNGLSNPNRVDLSDAGVDPGQADFTEAGSEQDALAEYLRAHFANEPFELAETDPAEDSRIQNLGDRDDQVIILPQGRVTLQQIGRLLIPGAEFDEGAAEIVAHHPASQRLYVINANAGVIEVLDVADPTNIATTGSQLDPVGDITEQTMDGVNSVAVSADLIAAAVEGESVIDNGRVAFYSTADLSFQGSVQVGPLPDMVAFTPDGNTLLVANEGEVPEDGDDDELRVFSEDVPGSVSVIDVSVGVGSATVTELGFADFNAGGSRADELPDGVRINPNATSVANDLEPEYVTVASDGSKAYVSLQENNALAVIDLAGPSIERIVALGMKDHGMAWNALDPSDDDDTDGGDCVGADCIHIQSWANVSGLYMPDGIATYSTGGKTYVVTANEGDGRGESTDECALKDHEGSVLTLDGAAFAAGDSDDENLGELTISCDLIGNGPFGGDTDGDGDLDKLFAFGARSASIVDEETGVIGDTGDDFERITAHLDLFGDAPFIFNDDNDDDSPDRDGRSDAKGPEPEGVVVGEIDGRSYAFIGLERVGGIMVYDVTNPRLPRFSDYINNRDFNVDGSDLEDGVVALDQAGDWGPEGLAFIKAEDSPNGEPLLAVGNEVSGTTTIYQINVE